jgi:integrase
MPDRAYGPYRNRDKFRVVIVGADGIRTASTYSNEATAIRIVAEVNAETLGRTVSDAINAFMAQSTMKPRSQKTFTQRLRGITGKQERLLRKLTPQVARDHFAMRAQKTSGDTQFHELASAHAFAKWCISKGWLKVDPFVGLKPTKPRKRGKPQLRIDEARKFIDTCLAEDSPAATAGALALFCGMRASSVTDRTVRDLDDGCRVLWIENDKTEAGDRRLEVPEVLRARLAALAAGRPGGAKLFVNGNRDWLRYHTRRLAKTAGVSMVSPHGLRGTHASLARKEVSTEHVARTLGHAGTAITHRHYIAPGIEREIEQRAVLAVLQGGKNGENSSKIVSPPKETVAI